MRFTMWVLILFYFSGGNPSVAMHDFSNKAACEGAMTTAMALQRELRAFRKYEVFASQRGELLVGLRVNRRLVTFEQMGGLV
jgi:hypothetical protein